MTLLSDSRQRSPSWQLRENRALADKWVTPPFGVPVSRVCLSTSGTPWASSLPQSVRTTQPQQARQGTARRKGATGPRWSHSASKLATSPAPTASPWFQVAALVKVLGIHSLGKSWTSTCRCTYQASNAVASRDVDSPPKMRPTIKTK